MSEANAKVMRRLVEEVINNGDYASLGELVHSDYVHRSPGEEMHGPEALKALFESYRSAFPNLSARIEDLVVSDDKAVIAFTLTGTHSGDFMGIPPTGKEIVVHAMVLSRFRQGKIAEEWELVDMLTMLRQLGVVSLPF